MKKIKIKKTNPVNQEETTIADFIKPHKSILSELLDLVFLLARIEIYTKAFQQRLDFPGYVEISNFVMDGIKKLKKLDGLRLSDAIKNLDKSRSQYLGELHTKNSKELLEFAHKIIPRINPYDQQVPGLFPTACKCLIGVAEDYDELTDREKTSFLFAERALTMKGNEAIGYWTAKLETKKTNKKNVKIRTTKKDDRKTELKEWMKTMKAKEYRLKAMQRWDVTERTVLHYEQEIRGEKTPIMRKKADTA